MCLCGNGNEWLENGAGSILRLNCTVNEWQTGCGIEASESGACIGRHHTVEVIVRSRSKNQQISIAGVECNCCSGAFSERGFCYTLQAEVEGCVQVTAGDGFFANPSLPGVSSGINAKIFLAAFPCKDVIVTGFKSGASPQFWEPIVPPSSISGEVLALFPRSTHIADDMRGKGTIRINPFGTRQDGNAWQFFGPFGKVGDRTIVYVFPNHEWHGKTGMNVVGDLLL